MTVKEFFFGKSKSSKITTYILLAFLAYIVVVIAISPLLFHEKYTRENFTFYSDIPSEELKQICDEIFVACQNQPFSNPKKKVSVYFCQSKAKYRLLVPFTAWNALGATQTFFNKSRIVEPVLDAKTKTIKSFLDKNNERNAVSVIVHEYFHACFTKTISMANRLQIPAWKEEGLAEYYAADSSYDVEEGIKRILNDTPDNSNSYKYFTYRLALSYMMNYEKKSQSEVLNDKRKLSAVLEEARALGEDGVREVVR